MQHYFRRLYQHNYDTNQQLIHYLDEQHVKNAQIDTWFSHLLNAHHIWLARLRGEVSPCTVWQEHPRQAWVALNQQAGDTTRQFLSDTEDLSQPISYQNSKGLSFQNRMDDILWHILNHSTHHRAQISTAIRQQGLTPQGMDYIFYVRNED